MPLFEIHVAVLLVSRGTNCAYVHDVTEKVQKRFFPLPYYLSGLKMNIHLKFKQIGETFTIVCDIL